MKKALTLTLLTFFFMIAASYARDAKYKRIYKGLGSVELYEKQTDSTSYFVLTFTNKFHYNHPRVSFRLDTMQLRKFALNFHELTKYEYADLALSNVTDSMCVLKTRSKATISHRWWTPVMTRQEDRDVKDLTEFIWNYLKESPEIYRSTLLDVENKKMKNVYKNLEVLWLAEYFTDSSSYYSLTFRSFEDAAGNGIAHFDLNEEQVRMLADALWDLAKPASKDGAAFAITDDMAVMKQKTKYFIGRSKAPNAWRILNRKQLVTVVNAIRKYYGAPEIVEQNQ